MADCVQDHSTGSPICRISALICLDYGGLGLLPSLPGTKRDFAKGRETLRRSGFERHELHGKQGYFQVADFIVAFVKRVREIVEEDQHRKVIVYFHFCGHGMMRPGSEWPSLLSSECRSGEDGLKEVHSRRVFGMLNSITQCREGLQIVFCLDCCRDGASIHQSQDKLWYCPNGEDLVPLDAGGGGCRTAAFHLDRRNNALVLFSCAQGKTAREDGASGGYVSQAVFDLFPQQVDVLEWAALVTRAVIDKRGYYGAQSPEYWVRPGPPVILAAAEPPLEEQPLPAPAEPLGQPQGAAPGPQSRARMSSLMQDRGFGFADTDNHNCGAAWLPDFLVKLKEVFACGGGNRGSDELVVGSPMKSPFVEVAPSHPLEQTPVKESREELTCASSESSTVATTTLREELSGISFDSSEDEHKDPVTRTEAGNIKISGCDEAAMERLAQTLAETDGVVRLTVMRCYCSSQVLARVVASMTALRNLCLDNWTPEGGLQTFMEQLRRLPHLTRLTYINITKADSAEFLTALGGLGLHHLTLSCNIFRADGNNVVQALTQVLPKLERLKTVDLSSNPFHKEGALILLHAHNNLSAFRQVVFHLGRVNESDKTDLWKAGKMDGPPTHWLFSGC